MVSSLSTTTALTPTDADLLVRIGIVLSIKRRAGWHLVRLAVQNGVVRLAGIVPSYYDRQLIAGLAQHVAGVMRVDDDLAIGDPSSCPIQIWPRAIAARKRPTPRP